jgi:AcrR family transcriptional regulator
MTNTTAETILAAALETLKTAGFAGATSRAIARTGDFNQALVFYHYGSLEALLGAALQRTSEERLAHYRERVGSVDTLDQLVPVMVALWEEDKAAGHVRVVSQMVAGSINRPELGATMTALMEPWIDLAEETIARVMPAGFPAAEAAYAIVLFYLGVNLATHLDPEHARADALFSRALDLAPLVEPLLAAFG